MPLSSPIENMKSHYTVVVVGSGYGGGVAASRLARAGQGVCLLERGKEFQPGEYPRTLPEASQEMQVNAPLGHIGSETALFDFHVNSDINVLVGCGLGGTSLINANVSIRAEPRLFEDPRWPAALHADNLLEEGYRLAEEMLQPTPYPDDQPPLAKLDALERSAKEMGEQFYRLPVNVTFRDGVNHVGVMQHACTLCGDCVSGCNYSAKNTTAMNYLPDAHNHGAEIYTEIHVERVGRGDRSWVVYYRRLHQGLDRFHAPLMFVTADVVVLAAGTLGTTEILLRSKQAGLPMSETVGRRFTGNGDVLGFAYDGDRPVRAVGYGHHPPGELDPVGPCITSVIDMRGGSRELEQGMVIEEGVTPGALAHLLPTALAADAATERHVPTTVAEGVRRGDSLVHGAYHGPVHNTQTFLVMAHDDAKGSMRLQDGRLRIDWPGVGSQPGIQAVHQQLERAAKASGATYLKNPLRASFASNNLITVHPLGGAAMADRADTGVVNHKGQVFSGADGEDVYGGLYVCDGSVMPMSLGVNPLLTITALSERSVALLARERGWDISYTLPSTAREQASVATAGIEFTERMKGSLSTNGKEEPFEFILSIRSNDVAQMLRDEQHAARINGSVRASALSAAALTVTDGHFQLFTIDPDAVNTRRMWYRMKLHSAEGGTYYFEGYKRIQNRQGFNVWRDTTTLFITVHRGDNKEGPVLGTGILKIAPRDFLTQLTTMRVFNAANPAERLRLTAEFGKFFAGRLFEVYVRSSGK